MPLCIAQHARSCFHATTQKYGCSLFHRKWTPGCRLQYRRTSTRTKRRFGTKDLMIALLSRNICWHDAWTRTRIQSHQGLASSMPQEESKSTCYLFMRPSTCLSLTIYFLPIYDLFHCHLLHRICQYILRRDLFPMSIKVHNLETWIKLSISPRSVCWIHCLRYESKLIWIR